MSVNIGGVKIPGLTYPRLIRTSEIYIDVAFLEEYIIFTGVDPSWPSGDFQAKQAALTRSQIYIDGLYYQGSQWWSDQILQWPRYPVRDKDDRLLSSEETPYDIFNAVAEGAFNEYKTPGILQPKESDSDLYPVQSSEVAAGSVSSKKAYDTSGRKAVSSADRLSRLQGYLRQWTVSTGTFIPIART